MSPEKRTLEASRRAADGGLLVGSHTGELHYDPTEPLGTDEWPEEQR